jgi:hypothetical protein
VPNFHPDLPAGCPPAAAVSMTSVLYRRTKKPPNSITNADFYSHGELGEKATDAICQWWGTSVWINMADVILDLENFSYLQKYRIVSFEATPALGVIQHTPTNKRPNHHTFWRDYDTDFSMICKIAYSPLTAEVNDAV